MKKILPLIALGTFLVLGASAMLTRTARGSTGTPGTQLVPTIDTFTAIDSVGFSAPGGNYYVDHSRLVITGVLSGQGTSVTRTYEISAYSAWENLVAARQSCERNGLLVLGNPGTYRLVIDAYLQPGAPHLLTGCHVARNAP